MLRAAGKGPPFSRRQPDQGLHMRAPLLQEKQGGPRLRHPRALFLGTLKGSSGSDGGFSQSIGITVVDVTPGDFFELIAFQTSGSTKNVAADELTWFADRGRWIACSTPDPLPRRGPATRRGAGLDYVGTMERSLPRAGNEPSAGTDRGRAPDKQRRSLSHAFLLLVALFISCLIAANIIAIKVVRLSAWCCRRPSSSFHLAIAWATC